MSLYLEQIKEIAKGFKQAVIFGKGSAFNADFPWDELADDKDTLRIGVDQATMYVKEPHLAFTTSYAHMNDLIKKGFKNILVKDIPLDWEPMCDGTHFAIVMLGRLGIKNVVTVGTDLTDETGFDYKCYEHKSMIKNHDIKDMFAEKHAEACRKYKLKRWIYESKTKALRLATVKEGNQPLPIDESDS